MLFRRTRGGIFADGWIVTEKTFILYFILDVDNVYEYNGNDVLWRKIAEFKNR